ncbi:unnamed protein product, partial [Chrysoparadoxa australica]
MKHLSILPTERTGENVFELSMEMGRSAFFQQLSLSSKAFLARNAGKVLLKEGMKLEVEEDPALYMVMLGCLRQQSTGLDFSQGDTLGYRPEAAPTAEIMAEGTTYTCTAMALVIRVEHEHAFDLWGPWGKSEEAGAMFSWSPQLAKDVLTVGCNGEGDLAVAIEWLRTLRPISTYSTELQLMLTKHMLLLHQEQGELFHTWDNPLKLNPTDSNVMQLVHCNLVIIVVSGMRLTCSKERSSTEGSHHLVVGFFKAGEVFPPHSGQVHWLEKVKMMEQI